MEDVIDKPDLQPAKRLKVVKRNIISTYPKAILDDLPVDKTVIIVLTGGPCAGKTSAMKHLHKCLTEFGYHVYTVPETPTILLTNGVSYPGEDPSKKQELIELESTVIRLQLTMEDSFLALARASGKKCVILCDRAVLDCKAYVPLAVWDEILDSTELISSNLIDRYSAICHLTTAADGAPTFYTLSNNKARTESIQQAIILDKKTRLAWKDHPNLLIVENGSSFQEKMESVATFVVEHVKSKLGSIN